MQRKWGLVVLVVVWLIGAMTIWILWANTALEITEYIITGDRIPEGFSGFRIVQISDLHNTEFGDGNEKLINMIEKAQPDIIVITGDMMDSRRSNATKAREFAEAAMEIAPVYYVPGNHEARTKKYKPLKKSLVGLGVTLLEDSKVTISAGSDSITLMGVLDPGFRKDNMTTDSASAIGSAIMGMQEDSDGFTVLLSHRPELFDVYASAGVDLVFTGHAHGGQIRLPFVGGLLAPNQGLFPKYDAGLFVAGDTRMIVSRGLGNSLFPLRVNNRPEIVVVQLERSPE